MELDQPINGSSSASNKKSIRLQVVDTFKSAPNRLELITSLVEDKTDKVKETRPKKVILEGVWVRNHIPPRCIIHLLDPLHDPQADTYIVNNNNGMIVIEPDSLLTCTYVASSLFCERKTWLNNVFLGQVGTNRAMLVGTLVHEVFQHGVRNKIADLDKLISFLDDLLDDAGIMLQAYSVEMHIDDIRKECISYVSSIKEWIEKFMLAGPRHPLTNDSDIEVKVIKVRDIEENVWSTKYGLKGKIDVTGLVRVYDKRSKKAEDKIIPLELKTGNPNLSSSHAAQVSLYSMMIEDRYAETNQGFVIYLKDKAAMHNVHLTHYIKRDLVQRRNQINYHMKNHMIGPDMIDQSRMCKNCERLTECVLMSNIYEPGRLDEFNVMKSLENDAIGHLDGKFITFFQKYHERLIKLMSSGEPVATNKCDTQNKSKPSNSFWTYSSEEAELRGTGFGKLEAIASKDPKNGTYITFRRHPKHIEQPDCEIIATTYVEKEANEQALKKQKIEDYFRPVKRSTIVEERRQQNVKPFNVNLDFSRCRIAISLDNENQDLDNQNSSTAIAIGFMNELKADHFTIKLYEGSLDQLTKAGAVFRVDKLEKRSQLDIERIVLVRLLERENWRADRIRQLLLEPTFEPKQNAEFNLFVLSAAFEEIAELDESHQKFVVGAVSTDNYFILDEKTEPDKGKVNRVISALARIVVELERSVLIVAQNVDQLVGLMKILHHKKTKFILLDDGKSAKARYQYPNNLVKVPQLASLDLKMKFNAYIKQHESSSVVITSYAMSVGGLLFTRRTFDYCIAYDCDTTELLLSLSPMFCSDRYVIVDIQREPSSKTSHEVSALEGEGEEEAISLGQHLRSIRKQQGREQS